MKKYFAVCFGETEEVATRAISRHQSRGGAGIIGRINGGNFDESNRYIEETTDRGVCVCVCMCVCVCVCV